MLHMLEEWSDAIRDEAGGLLPCDETEITACLEGPVKYRVGLRLDDVKELHQLRDKLLIGENFESNLSERLGTTTVELDRSAFAEEYEDCVLKLDELTPYQEEKMAECLTDDGAIKAALRIEGPAGCGKTFIALRLVIEELQKEGAVLFVCQHVPLALSVAKWIYHRVGKELTESLHVLLSRGKKSKTECV